MMADPKEVQKALEKFDGKAHISGFFGNILFFVHATAEDQDHGSQNDSICKFEEGMIADICDRLKKNNYENNHIRILSNSKIRQESISQIINLPAASGSIGVDGILAEEDNWREIRVTVILLVETEEVKKDDTVLANTVLLGIDDSRDGVIIIGHISTILNQRNNTWAYIINALFRKGAVTPFLQIECKFHLVICDGIKKPGDIRLAAPKGGCLETCTQRTCGHFCESVCHPAYQAHDKEEFWCKQPCTKKCKNGHRCIQICYKQCKCSRKCPFERECGHVLNNDTVCLFPCEKTLPCGHNCGIKCYECPGNHEKMTCIRLCNRVCKRGLHMCQKKHFCNTPCEPCSETYPFKLHCGHQLQLECSEPNFNELNYMCKQKCPKRYPLCNHECSHLCGEECGVCEQLHQRMHPKCGHLVMVPCHVPITFDCERLVPCRAIPRCGHPVEVPCYLANTISSDLASEYCTERCDTILNMGTNDCGHYCFGSCKECYQGRYHVRCNFPCEKMLICGHDCRVNCPTVCPPCSEKCFKSCEHYQCPYECGVPCNFCCQEPCSYECPHSKCSKKCGEVCDREGCREPCPKQLPCGHPCVGFCGEDCPNLCRFCNSEELLDGMFGGENSVDPDKRFIYLVKCGHTIEEEGLAIWMDTKEDDGEIRHKGCPICRRQIVKLRRYSARLHATQTEIEQVKIAIYGKFAEFTEIINRVQMGLTERVYHSREKPKLPEFSRELQNRLNAPFRVTTFKGGFFQSMYKDKASFIEWIFDIWEKAEEELAIAEHLWPRPHVKTYQELYSNLFAWICERNWPLHPNEVSSIEREIGRIKDAHMLYSRMSLEVDEKVLRLSRSREGIKRFMKAESILKLLVPYTPNVKGKFRDALEHFTAIQSYTLDISEHERHQIVQAFGGRSGRWFKCPKGHVYIVTECGGATEIGRCNECGETIGGENHRLLSGNQLASEMDGAEVPLYPTALYRGYEYDEGN